MRFLDVAQLFERGSESLTFSQSRAVSAFGLGMVHVIMHVRLNLDDAVQWESRLRFIHASAGLVTHTQTRVYIYIHIST